jgi:hypothetical protein
LALSADYLGILLAELADISERRIEHMMDPAVSEMAGFLTEEGGLNSGFMIAQVTAAALVSENKVLAHPASVDSIPTSANKEDHVSMGTHAARKAFEILKNFDATLWNKMREAAIAAQLPAKPLDIWGSDLYGDALKTSWRNLEEAGLAECVQLKQANILEISTPMESGIIVANMPYGERMGELDELADLYPKLGDALKKKFGGWVAYLFTADKAILKMMRLSPSKRTPLFNGAIECRLLEYKIVPGSNRRI